MAENTYRTAQAARWRRIKWGAFAIGVAGVVITLGVVRMIRVHEHQVAAAEFELRAHERALAIQQAFNQDAGIVRALAALYQANRTVSRTEFHDFVTPLMDERSSLAATGYNPIISNVDREQFEADLREAGFGDRGIVERNAEGELISAPPREDYVPVAIIEPLEGNKKAVGFNVASESLRRSAAERARSTRTISATGPIALVQDSGDQSGLLLFAPILEGVAPEVSVTGFAVGVIRVGDLVLNALANLAPLGIDFEVVDETAGESAGHPLYCFQAGVEDAVRLAPLAEDSIEACYAMDIAGRHWMLKARPTPTFVRHYQSATPVVALAVGSSLSLLGMLYLLRLGGLNLRISSSEARFRQITETIQEVFWIFDGETLEPEYISPAFESIYGRTADALRALPNGLLDCIHPEDREQAESHFRSALEGRLVLAEYRILREENTVRWISERRFPVRDAADAIRRIVGVSTDITARKVAESERDRLQAKAIQTQKLEGLGTLAGGLAHEFNNLLTGIQGHLEMGLLDLPADSPARADLRQVGVGVENAAELVAQMLASGGKGQFVIADTHLSELVKHLRPLLAALSDAPSVRIVYELANELPLIQCDPKQIEQVVTNLATNAVEALPPEGGAVTIRTGSMEAGDTYLQSTYLDEPLPPGKYVYVEVEDTGSGMSPQTIQHIFDPFYTTKFTGRGLGMAAVLGIVRSQRGAIHVDSRPGKGTALRVLLPTASSFWPALD